MATAATAKEKFDAAVNVIHSLPKNGSYQPSYAMMLSFYALYKQATLGTCKKGKPGFWDVIGRAKWDSWHRLGELSQEEAMVRYVDELKKIIETMPHTENVQEFVERLGDFYEVVEDDTPVARMVRSASPKHRLKSNHTTLPENNATFSNGSINAKDFSSDSSSESPENSPRLSPSSKIGGSMSQVGSAVQSGNKSSNCASNEITSDSGSDAEEFCDTSDISQIQDEAMLLRNQFQHDQLQNSSGIQIGSVASHSGTTRGADDHLAAALNRLQKDMNSSLVRLQAMETLFMAQKEILERNQRSLRKPNKWKLFAGINYPTIAFVIAWPLVFHLVMRYLSRKRN